MACHIDAANYKCKIEETKILPCGHSKNLMCYKDTEIRCKTQVTKLLPCGHEQMAACFLAAEDIKCDTEITKLLKCGHKVIFIY